MDELINALKAVQANSFHMYYKAHSYHWNVTGTDFHQMHDFFGGIYNEVWGAIDAIAEHIRTLDAYALPTLVRVLEMNSIPVDANIPNSSQDMVAHLIEANDIVINTLSAAHELAEAANKRGIVNYLEERLDIHEKHGWQLRSFFGA